MKPENKFRKWFLDKFTEQMFLRHRGTKVTVQKHADYATDGIADIDLSINGMTMWLEVKLLLTCQAERKLNATPLQRAYLENRAKGGVPTGVLVGLSLGPRKGYRVALFVPPISEVVHRDMFRHVDDVVARLYTMAEEAACASHAAFVHDEAGGTLAVDFARLDLSDQRESGDDVAEDGG